MIRCLSIICSVILVSLVALLGQVSAATITETKAAIGKDCVASDFGSTAMGYQTEASGYVSTTMGNRTEASGHYSTAMGSLTRASNTCSTAMGYCTTASGWMSTAMGYYTTASNEHSTVIGRGFAINILLENNIARSFMVGYMADASDTTPELFVKHGGVGIGTAFPNDDLHVANHIRVGEDATYQTVYGEIKHDGGGTGFRINANAGGGWADLHLQTDGTTRVFIESGGNVGIGTTSPGYRLEVNGDAAKPGGGSWSVSSDKRLKDITGVYRNGLAEIVGLQPYTFYYKKGNQRGLPSDKRYVGFVAQDVRQVFPDAVNEGPDGYLDFNMHPVNVALVNAVKELKAENDALRQEIQQIKALLGM